MIAIKDMEMPRNCLDCPIRNYRDDDGNRCDLTGLYNREDCCPLVEIVTCKDCKYYRNSLEHCTQWCMSTIDDFYCGFAESEE